MTKRLPVVVCNGLSHEVSRMQFYSSKNNQNLFDHILSLKKKNPSSRILKKAKSLNWATEILYFTNKLNANVRKKPCHRHYEAATSGVKNA